MIDLLTDKSTDQDHIKRLTEANQNLQQTLSGKDARIDQLNRQIDDLKIENVGLQQRILDIETSMEELKKLVTDRNDLSSQQ